MGNSKKILSLGLSALSILPMGALLSTNINAGAAREQEEQQGQYYTATFDFNGGTYKGEANVSIRFDKYLTLLPADHREGYKLIGWKNEGKGQIFTNEVFYDLNSDIHFEAVWQPIDVKLQPIDASLACFNYIVSEITEYLDKIYKGVEKIEDILGYTIDMMNIMKNSKKIAEVKEELSELDAKQEECIEQVEWLKFELGKFQRRADLFKNRVSEATEIVNSVIDQEQVSIDIINSLQIPILSLGLESQGIGDIAGIRGHLFDLYDATNCTVFANVDDFKTMLKNFYSSNKELFFLNVAE